MAELTYFNTRRQPGGRWGIMQNCEVTQMKVKRVTVSFEVRRSRQYQTLKFGLPEEIALEDGDDRGAVVEDTRPPV